MLIIYIKRTHVYEKIKKVIRKQLKDFFLKFLSKIENEVLLSEKPRK